MTTASRDLGVTWGPDPDHHVLPCGECRGCRLLAHAPVWLRSFLNPSPHVFLVPFRPRCYRDFELTFEIAAHDLAAKMERER